MRTNITAYDWNESVDRDTTIVWEPPRESDKKRKKVLQAQDIQL